MGLIISTLIYTSELILCSTVFSYRSFIAANSHKTNDLLLLLGQFLSLNSLDCVSSTRLLAK